MINTIELQGKITVKLIRNLLTFSAVILCFLLAACTSTLASSALPTAVNTAVPIVVPPTPPTAVPIAIPSTPTVETVATAVMPPVAEGSFTQQVVNAFNTGDYVWVNAHMGSEFTIAGWRAGGSTLPPAAAVDQFELFTSVQAVSPASN